MAIASNDQADINFTVVVRKEMLMDSKNGCWPKRLADVKERQAFLDEYTADHDAGRFDVSGLLQVRLQAPIEEPWPTISESGVSRDALLDKYSSAEQERLRRLSAPLDGPNQ